MKHGEQDDDPALETSPLRKDKGANDKCVFNCIM